MEIRRFDAAIRLPHNLRASKLFPCRRNITTSSDPVNRNRAFKGNANAVPILTPHQPFKMSTPLGRQGLWWLDELRDR
jgi:hypothetical protein